MNFNYKNPISPITSLGVISVPRTEVYGTNFSVLSTGGFMEVYSVSDLYYTIPSGSTGLIEYTGNTIPIQFQKGIGSVFSPDVLTLNSDNISSGRRRIGMLVYVIDQDQIYQYQIPNFENLWTGATTATGPGGSTVVISDFGTTIKSNSPEGIAFISAWTANTIEGISGETSSTAVWKKLVTGGGGGVIGDYLPLSGGTVTGDTIFTSGLTANTFSASTYLGLPQDVFVTGGTFSKSAETLTLLRNDNNSIPITGFTDVFVTGGTYANGTLFLTNNSGSTFSVAGFSTATGGTSNYYGSFSDTTNQSVSGANIATVWTYNTTELSNGIYIQDGSKIKVSNDGIYEIGYSAQIEKTIGGTSSDVTIWAVVNGNPVVRSSSTLTLANNNTYQLPFVSYIFELYAGDYVEFYFSSPSDHVQITTLSGLTTPTRPVSPSVIIVAKAIGNAVLNTSGDSFVTGFSLTNDTLTLSQNRVGLYSGFSVNLPYLNTSGGTITGNLSVSGSVSATTYYGDGSNLTGISRGGGGGAGGQLYYFNISNTQTPYYEFSTTATTAAEQTISSTASSNATVLIGGFMTPSTLPNITNFPAGILSFYFHTYDGGTNHSFNIYGELYKRTTGGTETLLFTSDATPVIGNVVSMVISDGYFSGATLNSSDRLVVKVYGTNLTNQTRTIYLVSEGSSHYSFALTTIPTFTDTYVTGFTYSDNTLTIKQNNNQADLTATINTMTGLTINGDFVVTGDTNIQSFSATTGYLSSSATTILQVNGTGGTLFNVGNYTSNLVYSINTPSGFPILNVYDDSTILMGSYLSLSLNTTSKVTVTGTTSVYSIPTSAYTGAFFDYVVTNGTDLRSGNIMSIWDGVTINFTEATTNSIGNTSAITFSVVLSGGNAILRATSSSGSWIVKSIVRSI